MNDRAVTHNRDVRRAATDIHDRRRAHVIELDARAESRREPFVHHHHAADVRVFRRGQQSPTFDMSHARINAHQRATAEERRSAARLAHEVGQHLARSLEVSDYAVE